jgi:hypothetical protein
MKAGILKKWEEMDKVQTIEEEPIFGQNIDKEKEKLEQEFDDEEVEMIEKEEKSEKEEKEKLKKEQKNNRRTKRVGVRSKLHPSYNGYGESF